MAHRVALVTHDLSLGGGTAAVTYFLHRILLDSCRYMPEIISLAISARDDASVRLLSPTSWFRGPQIQRRQWNDLPYYHVGAWLAEIEFQRYLPLVGLNELLESYDLIQIVNGTPAWGYVAHCCSKLVSLFTATTIEAERATRLSQESGPKWVWLKLMTELNARLESLALDRAECVFAESISTFERLKTYSGIRRLILAPPGVDTSFFQPTETKSGGYILSVGRFSDPRKNVRLLLRAYAKVWRTTRHVPELVLVGTPPSTEILRYIADNDMTEKVRIHGNVNEIELARLYREAIAFVLSSDEEGLGIVILEAMASGLPVVSTNCGGPSTAIVEGETGFLTPVGDADAMAEAIKRLLDDQSLCQRMGRAGRRVAEDRFSLAVTGKVYLDHYDRLLSESK